MSADVRGRSAADIGVRPAEENDKVMSAGVRGVVLQNSSETCWKCSNWHGSRKFE